MRVLRRRSDDARRRRGTCPRSRRRNGIARPASFRAPAERPCRHASGRRSRAAMSGRALQPLHHAPDRRDADAAGEQNDMAGVLDQRKIVARRADLERPADAQVVMHVARAAAARGIALDADRVAFGSGSGFDQRILPDRCRSADADRYGRRARTAATVCRRDARIRRGWCRVPHSGSRSGAHRSGRLPLAAVGGAAAAEMAVHGVHKRVSPAARRSREIASSWRCTHGLGFVKVASRMARPIMRCATHAGLDSSSADRSGNRRHCTSKTASRSDPARRSRCSTPSHVVLRRRRDCRTSRGSPSASRCAAAA